jgi:predicted RNase H-like HicB family nuclease
MSLERATLTIKFEREDDGPWIGEVPELPGVMAYGDSREDALTKAKMLARQISSKP